MRSPDAEPKDPANPRGIHTKDTMVDASTAMPAGGSQVPEEGAVDVRRFVECLSHSGLLSSDDLGAIQQNIAAEEGIENAAPLAQSLIQRGLLTPYQATLLCKGVSGGMVFGNYVVLELLGAGGMGMVFKSRHRRMKRIVALKVLPSSATHSAKAVQRFHREVEAAAKLSHPNIVAAFDADESEGVHFLVMEFVDGADFSRYVKENGPLSPSQAIHVVLQAARGLQHAHGLGVVHRDIKPSNILLDRQGAIKILDMGLARLTAPEDSRSEDHHDLTQSGRVMGTVDYMAPEQALDAKRADSRADIYSLGSTLYYLLAGKSMVPEGSLTKKLLWHQSKPAPALSEVLDEPLPELEAVYQKMVAKQPEDRQQSIDDVIEQLEALQASLPRMEPLDKIPDRESNQIEIPPELTNTSRSRSAGTMAEGFNASGSSVSSGSRPAYPGSGSGDLPTIAQMSISSEPLGQQTATVISPSTRQKSRLFPAVIAGALLLAIGGILGWAIMGNGNKNVAAHGDPNAQNLDGGTSPVVANPALTHGGVTATHPGDDSRNPDESTSPPSTESTSPPSTTDTGDSKDPTESHTPMPPVPAEPAEEPYRELLTWVFDLGGSATIVQGGDDPAPTTVASLDELPRPPYRVTGISLEETNVSAPQLARLIEMADLESLSLRNTGLNDSVMEQLVQFPRLKQLNLQATRLTDAALQSIRSMATLRRVNLSETGISQKGFATLQSQVPNLDIDWDANHWQRILLADVLALGATISAKVASEEMPKTFKKVENLPREDFQVVGVDLSGQPNLGDEHLDKILDLSDLQHVGLGYTAVTTEGLEKLTQLPRLKSIDLARLQIEEPSLSTWRGMHPRVQIVWKPAAPLTLAQWVLMSGGQVSILPAGEDQPRALKRGSNMPRGTFAIHSVGFAGVKEFDPSWLDSLVGLNGLRELDLRDTSFNDANVQGLIPLEGLRRLVLDQTRISGQGLRELARLPLLESLSLNHTPITDQDLASLVPLKTLKELSLAGTTIGDDAVESMVALKPLSVLDLQDTRLTPRGLKQLEAGLGEVCRIEANPEDPVRVAAKWVMAGGGSIELESGHRFQRLSELPPGPLAIRTVSLASVDPRDGVTVASLERCPELEEIDLVPLRANPRTILAALAERPLLTSRLLKLHLARSGIDDRIIGLLSNFTQLQLLDLSSNLRLTDASFKQLADLKALTELNLRNTNISDASLAQIASYSELVNLDLGGTRVSDQQITLLTSLKKLKILDLYGTRVTSEGAEKLKSELKLDRLTVDSPRRRNPSAEGQLPGGPGGVIPPQGIPPGNQPRPGGGFPPPGGAVQPRAF